MYLPNLSAGGWHFCDPAPVHDLKSQPLKIFHAINEVLLFLNKPAWRYRIYNFQNNSPPPYFLFPSISAILYFPGET